MLSMLLALALAAAGSPAASLAVPAPPGELRGQVLGPAGAPIGRFTVNGVAFESADGAFRILTPPEGEFRVVVRAEGYAPNVFHVQGASGKKLQIPSIRLGNGEHVMGEVLDAESDMPVAAARASLADPAKVERLRFVRPERVAPLASTGPGGWFELKRAPRGLLVLVVTAPGYLAEFVPVNTREPLPTVRLHRGGAIEGTVRDVRGAPLPGATVVAVSEEAGDGAETVADSTGRFGLEKLRAGRYRVVARLTGRAAGGEVAVADGAVTDVAIRMAAQAPLAMR